MNVAFDAERNWALPAGERREIVPGASHFAALSIASRTGAMPTSGHHRRSHLL